MDPAKLGDPRALADVLRGIVVDWDAVIASVETLGRDNQQLRKSADGLDRQHRELAEAYERLRGEREEWARTLAELRSEQEGLLREHQASTAALRELRDRYDGLSREHAAMTAALHESRERREGLARSRSFDDGQGSSSTAGLRQQLARQQSGILGLFRVSELALEDLPPAVLADMVLADAIQSLRSDAALMLLCDREGNFTESQKGNPVLVSQLHGLLDASFKELVKTGGKETLTLTGTAHPFSALAALIPNTGSSIGVLCLGREAEGEGFLPDEKQFLTAYARNIALGLQNILVRENLGSHLFDTMSFFVTALESKDSYLKGHSARVSLFAGEIAIAMGLSPSQVAVTRRAGVLHDLGKLMLPDSIRLKPKALAKEEYALIMRHPLMADKMLKPLRFLALEATAVRHHLERYDGLGYPDGLKGEEIPLPARVVAVADCFDAMISNRPYRTAMPIEVAVNEILRGAKDQFDPTVTDAFGSIPRARLVEISRYYGTPAGPEPPAGAAPDSATSSERLASEV